MILTLILILIIFSIYISIHFKNKTFTALIFAFFVGLILMVISNALYYIHRGLYSHTWLLNNRLLSRLISIIPFSFSTTRIISLVGETITMYTLVLFYLATARTKLRTYIIFGIFALLLILVIVAKGVYDERLKWKRFKQKLEKFLAENPSIYQIRFKKFFPIYKIETYLSLINPMWL